MATQGHRVLAVADRLVDGLADRPVDGPTKQPVGGCPDPAAPESPLRLVGLVAIADPPRRDAAQVVSAFQAAGVHLLMITGDHPHTARTVAARVGIDGADADVVTGTELAAGPPAARAETVRVYARTRPEQSWTSSGQENRARGDPTLYRTRGMTCGNRDSPSTRTSVPYGVAGYDHSYATTSNTR
jgi:magnesium-transporting ATPase (P-type)